MRFYSGGAAAREISYLFVDGGYLQRVLDERGTSFFGLRPELDYRSFFSGFEKIFYYDCYSEKKSSESEEQFKEKRTKQEQFFNELRSIDGCHVFLGSTAGEGKKVRQKQIDVMIAVHMLTHTSRQNMERSTLLSGDLDYKPLVEALVQEGMYITLWSDPSTTNRELIYAADSKRTLNIREFWLHSTKDFKKRFPPITASIKGPDIPPAGSLTRQGIDSKGGSISQYSYEDGSYLIMFTDYHNDNRFYQIRHTNLEMLEKYASALAEEVGLILTWETAT